MWIKKEKYDHLQEVIVNQVKIIGKYSQQCIDQEKKFNERLIPFSTYYAERLEWWKGQFDKEPENHKLRIDWNDNYEIIEKNNLESIEQTLAWFKKEKDFIEIDDFETNQKIIVPVNQIQNYTVIPGHPDPYTPEEIESWAKEQLEKEMKDWKVVKRGIEVRSGYHELHSQLRKQCEDHFKRYKTLSDISGD